jgi:hypothetical protein
LTCPGSHLARSLKTSRKLKNVLYPCDVWEGDHIRADFTIGPLSAAAT